MSCKSKKVSAVGRQQRVRFPRANPCSIIVVFFMLLLVICSHVAFYRSTVVHLPNSTALPSNNVSRRPTSTVWTTSRQRSSMEHSNNLTRTPRSSASTAVRQRLPKTAPKRDRSDSRIAIQSNNGIQTRDRKSQKVGMVFETVVVDNIKFNNDVNYTGIEVGHSPRPWLRGGARYRGSSAERRSRLLTTADDQSSTVSPSTSPTDASSSTVLV